MSLVELILIAIGVSMDAFAVALCTGVQIKTYSKKKSLIVGLYFGVFQAVMPLLGYLLGSAFSDKITAYDHWVAFILLGFIGGRMIWGSFSKQDDATFKEATLKPREMLPLAVATSIDALAIGVSFAFLQVNIAPAVAFIGIITMVLSMLGVKLGNAFGVRFKSKAELTGGIILVLMGIKILLEHMLV